MAESTALFTDRYELTMIDATQAAGDATMADGLMFLSETVHKTDAMVVTMRKAVTYPIVLLLMFASLLTGFSVAPGVRCSQASFTGSCTVTVLLLETRAPPLYSTSVTVSGPLPASAATKPGHLSPLAISALPVR